MGLVRAWARQLCGASAAVLVVPCSLAGAVAVLALAGGFGGLGSIGQALSGPALPAVDRAASSGASASLGGALNTVTTSSLAVAPALARHGAARIVARPPGATAGPVGSRTGGGGPGSQGQSGFATGGASNGSPAAGATPGPPKQPPSPGVLDSTLKTASSVASRLPGPAGSAGNQALQSVSSTAHKLLPSGQ